MLQLLLCFKTCKPRKKTSMTYMFKNIGTQIKEIREIYEISLCSPTTYLFFYFFCFLKHRSQEKNFYFLYV